MANLPAAYAWLDREPGPKMLLEARKLYGTREAVGAANCPEIMRWASEVGLKSAYSADSVPWCGLFMAVVARRAGKAPPIAPLWAKNWAQFGVESKVPMLGDVLVFTRDGGGHVGLYVGEDDGAFHLLGGNQSDAVTITRIGKSRLFRARRPIYSIAQPANVRRVMLAATGSLSTNEA